MNSWISRRSPVFSTKGIVSSSQPLATAIGTSILSKGGNAIDAAVGVAAALNLTEPCSTGIGGDAFVLFYDAKTKQVKGLNGSGKSAQGSSIGLLRQKGIQGRKMDKFDVHTITVPGAAALWCDSVAKWGTMSLKEILQPTIDLAKNGFPVSPITARYWEGGVASLLQWTGKSDMLIDGLVAPKSGELWKNPKLAETFTRIAEDGPKGFYEGRIAQAIVDAVQKHGGVMSMEDLKHHTTEEVEPFTVEYHGHTVHQIPPNTQGAVTLLALAILDEFDFKGVEHSSPEHLHLVIEALRLAFADADTYVCDMNHAMPNLAAKQEGTPLEEWKRVWDTLLGKDYTAARRALISKDKAIDQVANGVPPFSGDTVYFSVVDAEGNAASFINSNYMGFGSGLMPEGCGFTLQNRGHNFVLDEAHHNALMPGKKPYHTIMPGMITKDNEFFSCYGVMGGFMQPQGHVQVILNMIDYGMDPQAALDAPRVSISSTDVNPGDGGAPIYAEEGISISTIAKLKSMGHEVIGPVTGWDRTVFGRGQIINKHPDSRSTKVMYGGSDPRADGCAMPSL